MGVDKTTYINSEEAWSFAIPSPSTSREERPSVTVDFEKPVRLLGVDLQGVPGVRNNLIYGVYIQTEENGNFDDFVGSSTNNEVGFYFYLFIYFVGIHTQ